tara:strand:- start:68 stop:481 length:414 start_codon:yes stop_codon:yes gene_type:complete
MIQKNLFRNSRNYLFSKRSLLTPIEHIERTDINIFPFLLVMSISAGFWGWESYQHLLQLKSRVNSFQDVLQKCLQDNQSCEYVEAKLNSLLESKDLQKKKSMLIRVNTNSHTNLEITKQGRIPPSLPFGIEESEEDK